MKKIILKLLFTCFIFINILQGQDTLLVATPSALEVELSVEQQVFDDEYYTIDLTGFITNISADTLSLKWEREEVNVPEEWESTVGDNNITYPPQVWTNYNPDLGLNQLLDIPPGAESLIGLFVLPRSTSGCGQYNIHFSEIGNLDSILLTIPYEICYNLATAVQQIDKKSIKLYPNPADTHFSLSLQPDQPFSLTDLNGTLIRTFNDIQQNHFSIADIPSGIYWLRLTEEKETLVLPLVITR